MKLLIPIFLLICFSVARASTTPALEEARGIFYQDAQDYIESNSIWLDELAALRNAKLSEDFQSRISELEKNLVQGNQTVIQTVEKFQDTYKEGLNLDDTLLMRMAQLYFDEANFDFNKKMQEFYSANKKDSALKNQDLPTPDYKKSLSYAQRLLRLYPNSELADRAEYLISYIYEETGDFEKAKAIYHYFVLKYPYSQYVDEATWRLAELEFEAGNIKSARSLYLSLSKKTGSKFELKAIYKLGASLFENGLYDWSTKMFVRLYDRLKADYATSAERKTLYDESLEYLGLLQRKGVKVQLDPETEALSSKKLAQVFKRHQLRKEAENVYLDYIKKYPLSSYVPEFFDLAIKNLEEAGKNQEANALREKFIQKFFANMSWWKENKENAQARFEAEEDLEFHSLELAKNLADSEPKKAVLAYENYIQRYPNGQWTAQAQYEKGLLLYDKQDYKAASESFLKATESAGNNTLLDNSAYSYFLCRQNLGVMDAEAADLYLKNASNPERIGKVSLAKAEYLYSKQQKNEALDSLLAIQMNSADPVTNLQVLRLKLRIYTENGDSAKIQEVEREMQKSVRSIASESATNLEAFHSNFWSEALTYSQAKQYDKAAQTYLSLSLLAAKKADRDKAIYFAAVEYRNAKNFTASNQTLEKLKTSSLRDTAALLESKNYFDSFQIPEAEKAAVLVLKISKNRAHIAEAYQALSQISDYKEDHKLALEYLYKYGEAQALLDVQTSALYGAIEMKDTSWVEKTLRAGLGKSKEADFLKKPLRALNAFALNNVKLGTTLCNQSIADLSKKKSITFAMKQAVQQCIYQLAVKDEKNRAKAIDFLKDNAELSLSLSFLKAQSNKDSDIEELKEKFKNAHLAFYNPLYSRIEKYISEKDPTYKKIAAQVTWTQALAKSLVWKDNQKTLATTFLECDENMNSDCVEKFKAQKQSDDILWNLLKVNIAQNNLEEAKKYLAKLLTNEPDSDDLLALAVLLNARETVEDAKLMLWMKKTSYSNALSWVARAQLNIFRDSKSGVDAILKNAVLTEASNPFIYAWKVTIDLQQKFAFRAQKTLEIGLRNSDNHEILIHTASILDGEKRNISSEVQP